MAGLPVGVEDALAYVFAEDVSDDSLSDNESSDDGMSSEEEEQLDLALLGDEVSSDQASQSEEEEETAPARHSSSDSQDDSSSADQSSGHRVPRETRRSSRARGRSTATRGNQNDTPSRVGRAGRAVRTGRGGRGGAAPAAVPTPAELRSWDDDDERPQLPPFAPTREPGSHLPPSFKPELEVALCQNFA
eukprot:scpid102647/ scgid27802/ 